MAKRPSLRSDVQAPDRRSAAMAAVEKMAPAPEPKPSNKLHPSGRPLTMTVTTDRETLRLLRDVARERQERSGEGRASVSAVIQDLIERHRAELEAERDGHG